MNSLCRIVFGVGFILFAIAIGTKAQNGKSTAVDPATVAAYEKLGAKHFGANAPQFDVPTFIFGSQPKARLPDANVPFGLSFDTMDDAGLKELGGLKHLTALDLYRTKITDAGLKELAGLAQLQVLGLGETKVTDLGLKELSGLKQLELLNLQETEVTDEGLKELAGLKKLQDLNLDHTNVSDVGLKKLAGLGQLMNLNLVATQVTNEGITELRKALPKCKVIHR